MIEENLRIEPSQCYVAPSPRFDGLGVFAARDFAELEAVEVCRVLVFTLKRKERVPEDLERYVFNWRKLAKLDQPAVAIALGFGSLYNHDDPANLRYEADAEAQTLTFRAARPIGKDEELTINYNALGGGPTALDDNWFRWQGLRAKR